MIAKFLGLFVLLRGRKQVRNSWRKMGFSPTFFQSVCVERKRKRTVLLKVGKEIEFQARPANAEYEGPQSGFSPTQPPENNVPLENTTPLRMDPEPTAAHFALSGRKETFMLRYGGSCCLLRSCHGKEGEREGKAHAVCGEGDFN